MPHDKQLTAVFDEGRVVIGSSVVLGPSEHGGEGIAVEAVSLSEREKEGIAVGTTIAPRVKEDCVEESDARGGAATASAADLDPRTRRAGLEVLAGLAGAGGVAETAACLGREHAKGIVEALLSVRVRDAFTAEAVQGKETFIIILSIMLNPLHHVHYSFQESTSACMYFPHLLPTTDM